MRVISMALDTYRMLAGSRRVRVYSMLPVDAQVAVSRVSLSGAADHRDTGV